MSIDWALELCVRSMLVVFAQFRPFLARPHGQVKKAITRESNFGFFVSKLFVHYVPSS